MHNEQEELFFEAIQQIIDTYEESPPEATSSGQVVLSFTTLKQMNILLHHYRSQANYYRFMVDNGLGPEDMKNDIHYPER